MSAAGHPAPGATAEAAAHGAGPVHEAVMHGLSWVVLGINVVCAAVLLWGVVVGIAMFLRAEAGRRADAKASWPALRHCVGQYLLFALELLIAADIIETMIRPTLDQLAILAGVSALRIVTGFALGKELEHLGPARPGA